MQSSCPVISYFSPTNTDTTKPTEQIIDTISISMDQTVAHNYEVIFTYREQIIDEMINDDTNVHYSVKMSANQMPNI